MSRSNIRSSSREANNAAALEFVREFCFVLPVHFAAEVYRLASPALDSISDQRSNKTDDDDTKSKSYLFCR